MTRTRVITVKVVSSGCILSTSLGQDGVFAKLLEIGYDGREASWWPQVLDLGERKNGIAQYYDLGQAVLCEHFFVCIWWVEMPP